MPNKYKDNQKSYMYLYDRTPKRRLYYIRKDALKRGYEFEITIDDIMFFWKKPCYYCGEEMESVGLDRVDNKKGYLRDNIVSCCILCNKMKMGMSLETFLRKIREISKKHC